MNLEIVSHCWNYSRLLTYQLSSLVLQPPQQVSTIVTVFFCEEDDRTQKVLDYFGGLRIPNIRWNWWALDRPQLMRRAIGRNLAALRSTADWVWFADADMCFGQGSLDRLRDEVARPQAPLVFPRQVQLSRTEADGDAYIEAAGDSPRLLELRAADFVGVRYNRAIGGVQISRGDVVRSIGYCKNHRHYQKPSEVWRRATEDVTFRKTFDREGSPVDVPEVYRIMHSLRGREHVGVQL